MPDKHFLVKDHSGRGIAVTLSLSEIIERWDVDFKRNPNADFEESFGDWLESADVGDTYENHEGHVTFTRTD